jgi:hypothetical protein
MSNLEKLIAANGGDDSERKRQQAAIAAESLANTKDFVLAMRGRQYGNIALYTRLVLPAPVLVADRRPLYQYSPLGRGWAVVLPNSEAATKHAFVIDNPQEPTVYNDAKLPSTSNNLYVRPDSNSLEKPCLILHEARDQPAREHAVVLDMFAGEHGLRLLANAVEAKGLPGF